MYKYPYSSPFENSDTLKDQPETEKFYDELYSYSVEDAYSNEDAKTKYIIWLLQIRAIFKDHFIRLHTNGIYEFEH